tara:strand:- start:40717 stop:41271 length:555 start_codon:yes stop_codon:yes gene_type:complete
MKHTNADKTERATTLMASKKRARTSARVLNYIEPEAPEDNTSAPEDVTSSLENDDSIEQFAEEQMDARVKQISKLSNEVKSQEISDSENEEEPNERDKDFIDDKEYTQQPFRANLQDEVSPDEDGEESEDELINEIRASLSKQLEEPATLQRANSSLSVTKHSKQQQVRKRVRQVASSDEDDDE